MKQVLQNLSSGDTTLVDIPVPRIGSNSVLIESKRSLISVGTERMLVGFGKAGLIDKARQQPEKVKEVLQKASTDGVVSTYNAVRSKLDQPLALGYCNAGVVLECGANVSGFVPGDRVVSNGSHATAVVVSENLVCKIPDTVGDDEASFTVLAAIALQGIRLVKPTLGETVVVVGLGVIGLLAVQLLLANGCRVIGVELDDSKLELAKSYGAETVSISKGEDPVKAAMNKSGGHGVDAVLITASAKTNDIVSQAARMCRTRGRIVLVGVVGLELNRAEFYEKELTFQVSCSYGPGRYDPNYEEFSQDYPIGFVRWTENRNFGAILDLMARESIDISSLITHRFDFDDAVDAYDVLNTGDNAIGILLEYPDVAAAELLSTTVQLKAPTLPSSDKQKPVCAFIGAGNYASRVLIPAFAKAGASFDTIVSQGGVSARHHGDKNGFTTASTNTDSLLADPNVNTVAIVTRHNTHGSHVLSCLKHKKNTFVEKPLGLSHEELDEIERAYLAIPENERPRLMVGFNRRFAPLVKKMKHLVDRVSEPKTVLMTMNAGSIPSESWVQDVSIGGGRIIGEACHYIDLMRFIIGAPIIASSGVQVHSDDPSYICSDKAVITLQFADGSIGCIHYLANGGKAFPKERIEVFGGDAVLQLDNFKKLTGFGWQGFKSQRAYRPDKGQEDCAAAFLQSISEGAESPIPFEELMEVSRWTVDIAMKLQQSTELSS